MYIMKNLYDAFVDFYTFNRDYGNKPYTTQYIKDFSAVKSHLNRELVLYSNELEFTNIHEFLSPIALTLDMQYRWCLENNIDSSDILYKTKFVQGFDCKFPHELLNVMNETYKHVHPEFKPRIFEIRSNLDFKDVVYDSNYYE